MIAKTLSVLGSRLWLLCAIALILSLWPAPAVHAQESDRDGDGTPDRSDHCPDEAGPKENNGCPVKDPDSDGDGVPDSMDRCPREVGRRENGGCPVPPESPPDSPPAPGGDTGDTSVEPDRLPPDPDVPEAPALLLPAMPEEGLCVVATQGTEGVNIRKLPRSDADIIGGLDPELLYPVVMSFQTPEGLWWLLEQGGLVAGRVTRQGGDCASVWTLLGDGSVRFVSDSVSPSSWPTMGGWGHWEINVTGGGMAATQSSPQLAHVVSIGGQPIATIGGSEALTVGSSQTASLPMEQISFVYEQIEWNWNPADSGDPDLPIILGRVPDPDDAAASGDFASADCPLLPEMEGVTCQPGQPYLMWTLKNVRVTSYSISGSGLDSAGDTVDALGVPDTPLIVVPEAFQVGGTEPVPAVIGDLNAFEFDAVIWQFEPGGVEFQDSWEEQTATGGPPVIIGLPPAASGKGPSLLIGGDGYDVLIGSMGSDETFYALQLFALVDDAGMFWFFDPDNAELLEGATLVHVAEIVVAGDEQVLVVVAQPAPDQLTIGVLPAMSKDWIELQSYQMGVQP
jgi:hypothetical protein